MKDGRSWKRTLQLRESRRPNLLWGDNRRGRSGGRDGSQIVRASVMESPTEIRVADYGAICNCLSDDTQAIKKAAMNAAYDAYEAGDAVVVFEAYRKYYLRSPTGCTKSGTS